MIWLSLHQADIKRFGKAVHLNLPINEPLVICGDKSSTNLRISSCIQAQKRLRKEYQAFLAHTVEASQEEQDIKNIPELRDFQELFPEELQG